MSENIIKLRRYINSDNNPLYVSEREYISASTNGSKLITYNEPELLTRYKVIEWIDIIIKHKKID